ncbi:MAG: hypothetical protein PUB49_04955 [Selenomonadaceae bacterium]|nr:hypothetical protein [Selenomonadaceae bacterium]
MGYTRSDCERLVRLADKDGRITYEQIHKEFPEYDSSSIYDWIGDSFRSQSPFLAAPRALAASGHSRIMLFWDNCPDNYVNGYQFNSTDTFHLSVNGEDLRYQLKKEDHQESVVRIGIILSAIAACASVIALFR